MITHMKHWINQSYFFSNQPPKQGAKEKEFKALLKLRETFSDLDIDECSVDWEDQAKRLEENIEKYIDAKESLEQFYQEWNELSEEEQASFDEENPNLRINMGKENIELHSDVIISTTKLLTALEVDSRFTIGKY
jgi:Fic family protein